MKCDNTLAPVPTRAAHFLKSRTADFQYTVFEEPKCSSDKNYLENSKLQKRKTHGKDLKRLKNEDVEFDIKKARNDVLNFAISGHSTKSKKKMEIFKAIQLGAKPPKKEYKNYKVLVDEKRRLKAIREERHKFHQLGKNQTGAASVKCRKSIKEKNPNKRKAPVIAIERHYGVVNPKIKKKK